MFIGMPLGMVPWMVYLAYSLPSRANTPNYSIAWLGFDAMLAASALLTAILAIRHSRGVQFPAFATAVLLFVDAWFDVITARSGGALTQAVILAAVAEVPLAIVMAWLAVRAGAWAPREAVPHRHRSMAAIAPTIIR